MSRGRKREPTAEELALWEAVKRSAIPLGKEKAARIAEPPPKPPATPAKKKAAERPLPAVAKAEPKAEPARHPALSPLDRRTRSRLTRGTVAIDARVDLHGLTQSAAHDRLRRFLGQAQADGARVVLVITGKGKVDDGGGQERGVLRRMVPAWLSAPDLRQIVIGFDEAARPHGGAGALYVRIRRAR